LHWILNGTYLVGSIKSFKNQVAQAEAMLLDFVHGVEPQGTVGPSASFCLGGVTVTGKYLSELASFHFASAQMPDTPGEKDSDQDLSFLETMRPVPSSAASKIHLEMDVTGAIAHNEKASRALWDGVVKTIRQSKYPGRL
jgi:hypothetical protein